MIRILRRLSNRRRADFAARVFNLQAGVATGCVAKTIFERESSSSAFGFAGELLIVTM
jgi:hypothetical protein